MQAIGIYSTRLFHGKVIVIFTWRKLFAFGDMTVEGDTSVLVIDIVVLAVGASFVAELT